MEGLHGDACTLSTFFQLLLLSFSQTKATIRCSFSLSERKDTSSEPHLRSRAGVAVRPASSLQRLPGSIFHRAHRSAVSICWVIERLQKVDPFEKAIHHYYCYLRNKRSNIKVGHSCLLVLQICCSKLGFLSRMIWAILASRYSAARMLPLIAWYLYLITSSICSSLCWFRSRWRISMFLNYEQ